MHNFEQVTQLLGEGNGNPLQYSCLENPRDVGACWAAVSGVAQSQTQLNQLSSIRGSINGDEGMNKVEKTAAAKSLQSCSTLCDPIDSSLLGSSVPGILQARILEWVAISFSNA